MKKISEYFNKNQGMLAVAGIVVSIFLAIIFGGESKNNNVEDTLKIVQQSIEQRDLQNPTLRKFIRAKYGKDYEEMDDYSIAVFWEDLEKYLEEVKESEKKYEEIKGDQDMTDEERKLLISEIDKAREGLDYQKVNQLLSGFEKEDENVAPSGWVTGVFLDRNENPVQADYYLMDEQDKKYYSKRALTNGSFKTETVLNGKYKLYITDSNHFGGSRNMDLEVKVYGDVELGNVVLPYSWVTGVFLDRNENPVQANYYLTDEEDKRYGYSERALTNGSFKTEAVPDGKYTLHIADNSYFGGYRNLDLDIEISGSDVELGNVVLPYSWVTGVFLDRNGNPLQASYYLIDEQDKRHGSSRALTNGSFKTEAVPDGKYTLHVQNYNYRSIEKMVMVAGKDISLGKIILEEE